MSFRDSKVQHSCQEPACVLLASPSKSSFSIDPCKPSLSVASLLKPEGKLPPFWRVRHNDKEDGRRKERSLLRGCQGDHDAVVKVSGERCYAGWETLEG